MESIPAKVGADINVSSSITASYIDFVNATDRDGVCLKGGNTLTLFKSNEDIQRFAPLLVKGNNAKILVERHKQLEKSATILQKAWIKLRDYRARHIRIWSL